MKPVTDHARIHIDFGREADYPVSHDRIALFNSGLVTADTYQRDSRYFQDTHPEHLRIDLGWGAEWMPWKHELVAFTDGQPVYHFDETDQIARILTSCDVRPYWSYSYVPAAIRRPRTDWRTLDDSDDQWVNMVAAYVAGAHDRGVHIGYHEVYNEPDLRDERTGEAVFFAGDLDDYLNLYRQTASAIREADPQARIGGPALASVAANAHWLTAFLDMVTTENLPLDFLSFHHYGTYGIRPALETVLNILNSYPQLPQVELHLNEYNSFTIDYPEGGVQDSHFLASALAQDVEYLLSVPRLTRVSWAQFLDSGNDNYSGMVTIDGAPKPVYQAYRFLQQMPTQRSHTIVHGPDGVGVIASTDDAAGAAIIYNRSSRDVTVTVTATNFEGQCSIVLIDSTQNGDQAPAPVHEEILLERGATALLNFGSASPGRQHRISTRTRYDFTSPDGWADVDESTATARLGTGTGADRVRIGMDLPAGTAPDFSTTVTDATGAPTAGQLNVGSENTSTGITVWMTLTGAAPHTFAVARLTEAGQ